MGKIWEFRLGKDSRYPEDELENVEPPDKILSGKHAKIFPSRCGYLSQSCPVPSSSYFVALSLTHFLAFCHVFVSEIIFINIGMVRTISGNATDS